MLCVHLPQAAAANTRERRPTPAPPITAIHLSVSAVRWSWKRELEDELEQSLALSSHHCFGAGGSSEDLTQARPRWLNAADCWFPIQLFQRHAVVALLQAATART